MAFQQWSSICKLFNKWNKSSIKWISCESVNGFLVLLSKQTIRIGDHILRKLKITFWCWLNRKMRAVNNHRINMHARKRNRSDFMGHSVPCIQNRNRKSIFVCCSNTFTTKTNIYTTAYQKKNLTHRTQNETYSTGHSRHNNGKIVD